MDQVIERAGAWMFVVDENLEITHASDALLEGLGRRREDVVGRMTCAELFGTALCGTEECLIERCMRTGLTEKGSVEAEDGRGGKIPLSAVAGPLYDGAGRPAGGVGILSDLSAVREARSDAAVKGDYLDKIPVPVVVMDREFNVRFVNEAGGRTLGMSPEQCIGRKCFNLFNTGHCRTGECRPARAMRDGAVFTGDTVAALPSGKVPIRYSAAPLKDGKGEITGCLEFIVDITEERRITEALLDLGGMVAEGRLEARAEVDAFEGNYRRIVTAANGILDAFAKPLGVAVGCLDALARGEIPEKITEEYKGDFGRIKASLNACADMMSGLSDATGKLLKAAAEGCLDERIETGRFEGDWGRIAEGINRVIDSVAAPLKAAAGVLEKAAAKDVTVRVAGDFRGVYAALQEDINRVMENLDAALSMVGAASSQVLVASSQISSGSQSLAQAASEQASSLEEIRASLEEMNSMAGLNAANAEKAKNIASLTMNEADKGIEAMNRMSLAVGEIKESSGRTAKIVKTIDEIAFQTNLLALNAAVEAARAGEAGKGFAVVAEEVRNLAQRAAEAAKNTTSLIEVSVKNADNGVKISEGVANALQEIAAKTKQVDVLVSEIAAASSEQSQGVGQVSVAVGELDKLTQRNAADSEESASSAEELDAQVRDLSGMIAEFKLSGGGAAPGSIPAHPFGTPRRAVPQLAPREGERDPSGSGRRADGDFPLGDDEEILTRF